MGFKNSKEYFYYELENKISNKDISSKEFIDFINSCSSDNSGNNSSFFYELCSKFTDISLNAKKVADPITCDITACFLFNDIDAAKSAFISYMNNNHLTDAEGILDAIFIMHPLAVADDDNRTKASLVRPTNYDGKSLFAGKYHDFCVIPYEEWEEIRNEIMNILQQ